MDEITQLISFFVSFLFGMGFHFFSDYHFKIISKYSMWFQYLITFLFIIDTVLSYILLMYHVNYGVFHVYFLAFVFLGFFMFSFLQKNIKLKTFFQNQITKIFHR